MSEAPHQLIALQRAMIECVFGIPGMRDPGGVWAVAAGMGAGKTQGIVEVIAAALEMPGVEVWVVMSNLGQIDKNLGPIIDGVLGKELDVEVEDLTWRNRGRGVSIIRRPATGSFVRLLYYNPAAGASEANNPLEGGNPWGVIIDEVQQLPMMVATHAAQRARRGITLEGQYFPPWCFLIGRPAENTWHQDWVSSLRRREAEEEGINPESIVGAEPQLGQLSAAQAAWDAHLDPYWTQAESAVRRDLALKRGDLAGEPAELDVMAAMDWVAAADAFAEAHPRHHLVLTAPDGYITASAHDNHVLDAGWYRRMRATMTKREYAAKIDGLGIPPAADGLHPAWDSAEPWPFGNLLDNYTVDPDRGVVLSIDCGYRKPAALAWQSTVRTMLVCPECRAPMGTPERGVNPKAEHLEGCGAQLVEADGWTPVEMPFELAVIVDDWAPDGHTIWKLSAGLIDRGFWPRAWAGQAPQGAVFIDRIITGKDAGNMNALAGDGVQTIADAMASSPVRPAGEAGASWPGPGLGTSPLVLTTQDDLDLGFREKSIDVMVENAYGHRRMVITAEAKADAASRPRRFDRSMSQMRPAHLLRARRGGKSEKNDKVSDPWDAGGFYAVVMHPYEHHRRTAKPVGPARSKRGRKARRKVGFQR